MAKKKINVDGKDIALLITPSKGDYISLTDIDRNFDGNGRLIENWLRNPNVLEFLEGWENLYNPNFNSMVLHGIKKDVGKNRFILSVKKWLTTGAIGIEAKAGRYGGTYAHPEIAFNFAYWVSPTFQLYVAKEFKRLKEEEAKRLNKPWNLKRELTKGTHFLQTEAVREYLVRPIDWHTKREAIHQASEADLLNLALFGMTAKDWRRQNPKAKGNIRDNASAPQLLVLSNLQSLNSKLIEWDSDKEQRLEILHQTAKDWLSKLANRKAIGNIKKLK